MQGRVIGAFGMTWGAYVIIVSLVKNFAINELISVTSDIGVGALTFLAALPLVFTDKTMRMLFSESQIVSSILVKLFGVPNEVFKTEITKKTGQSGAVVLGIIFGLLTYFIPAFHMVCAIAIAVCVGLILVYPEGGVLISIAIAPLVGVLDSPSIMLGVTVLMTAVSYFVKVLRGKRVFTTGITGLAVYAFMLVVFLSGFAPGESNTMENALLCCSLMLIFPLALNLMKSGKWINACIIAFVAPSAIVAFVGVAEYLLGMSPSGWVDSTMFSSIESRAVSLFNNPNILGAYLAALFPMALSLTLPKYNTKIRVLGGIVSLYIVLATAFTFSRSAWLAIVAGGILFAMLISPKGLLWCVPVAGILVLASFIFPETIGARLINFVSVADSANNYRIAVWNSSWNLLSDCFLFGIGWGEEAFRTAYLAYGADGTQYAMHSHSLYMQVVIQCGAVGLLLLLAAVFCVFRKCLGVSSRMLGNKYSVWDAKAAVSGAVSLMIVGIFDYSWYNFRVFFIFWALLAFACAVINVENAENEYYIESIDDEYSSYVRIEIPVASDSSKSEKAKEKSNE
jgi:putative inorganic carbon (HCO3(-)) transporter